MNSAYTKIPKSQLFCSRQSRSYNERRIRSGRGPHGGQTPSRGAMVCLVLRCGCGSEMLTTKRLRAKIFDSKRDQRWASLPNRSSTFQYKAQPPKQLLLKDFFLKKLKHSLHIFLCLKLHLAVAPLNWRGLAFRNRYRYSTTTWRAPKQRSSGRTQISLQAQLRGE